MIYYSNIHDMNKLTNNKSTQGRGSVIRYMYQVWYFVSFLRCFYLDIMAIMKPTNMSKISTVTFLFFKKNQMSDCICFTHFLYPCPRSCDFQFIPQLTFPSNFPKETVVSCQQIFCINWYQLHGFKNVYS